LLSGATNRRSEISVHAAKNHQIRVATTHSVRRQGHPVATQPGYRYKIRIKERLGATALSAFPTMGSETLDGETVLTGSLEDQSAVYGVLAQIEALGLELIELRRLGPSTVEDR
jgi:hypothetical protein